ncbi:MAG: hypothetical protein ABJJ53_02390 [Sulfitobacter sp.]
MSLERLQSALLVLGMLIVYFFVMPGQVDLVEDARIVPRTVPSIAIGIIALAGVVQFLTSKAVIDIDVLLCVRAAICTAFVIACVAGMERFGFEYVAPILALGVMLGIGERRPHWLFIGVFVIPIGVWLLVERVLDRILA